MLLEVSLRSQSRSARSAIHQMGGVRYAATWSLRSRSVALKERLPSLGPHRRCRGAVAYDTRMSIWFPRPSRPRQGSLAAVTAHSPLRRLPLKGSLVALRAVMAWCTSPSQRARMSAHSPYSVRSESLYTWTKVP